MAPFVSISQRGTCLLVSLLLLSLEVESGASFNQPFTGPDVCFSSNIEYDHGDVLNLPGYSHCVKHRCNYGSWILHEKGCKDHHGACHAQGSEFPYAINGKLYNQCTCTVFQNLTARHSCRVQ